VRRY